MSGGHLLAASSMAATQLFFFSMRRKMQPNLAGTSLWAGNISNGLRDIHPDAPFHFSDLQHHQKRSTGDQDAAKNGTRSKLLMEQYCGQNDGDHDAEFIDGNDL